MVALAFEESLVEAMQQRSLSPEQVESAYKVVVGLYPDVPPLAIWRAWECAAYTSYRLPEPVLDIGCGDGRFFHFLWPDVRDVAGVDAAPAVVDAAWRSGVYRQVHLAEADQAPLPPAAFASAFANCSLEHMDRLPQVLIAIARALRPGGSFLFSVVTDRLIEWATLAWLLALAGEPERARSLQREYEAYHHLVNALSPGQWVECLEAAGLEVLGHVPIVPLATGRLFLLLDQLWHLPHHDGELGSVMQPYFAQHPRFPGALLEVLGGVLQMETEWMTGSGAVFWGRRER